MHVERGNGREITELFPSQALPCSGVEGISQPLNAAPLKFNSNVSIYRNQKALQ
jgi:hypothetical protein